jgi:uroporphyrinogen-III synthase
MRPLVVLTQSNSPDLDFLTKVTDLGYDVCHIPALSVSYEETPPSFKHSPDTLIVTSKHALNSIEFLNISLDVLVLCVGQTTGDLLQKKGFKNIYAPFQTGDELITSLHDNSDTYGNILFLRGKDVQHDIQSVCTSLNIPYQEHIVYSTHTHLQFLQDVQEETNSYPSVIFCIFSKKGAISFAHHIKYLAETNTQQQTRTLCLSDKMIQSLGSTKGQDVYVCDTPTQASMIKTLNDIKGDHNYE